LIVAAQKWKQNAYDVKQVGYPTWRQPTKGPAPWMISLSIN